MIFAFLWELALSKITNLFLNFVVICSCKKSYNLLLSIPPLWYKSHPKTPSVDIENGNLQTFRYTQNQRRLETRLKKYNIIIDKINKETKIENQTIKEIETEL